ncbi:class I SAM-dependent methyltransferase [Crossiella cryophila]|uniref:SAM-dependent methyltransferase n=1 Tax=Crossiella cryophila TaxID=43355 RepID=A0A7W7FY92_9PSEU|nr:class I SAM-dependent methyltransferase [Crossiella cryophila]MBB4681443.1 SAM-dependent methyltransferase [Crossiella cryophila]
MDGAALKAGWKWMMSELGDYRPVAARTAPAAELLVEWVGVTAGQRVLEVASGPGSAARAAARRHAQVTATDLTPEMLDLGRELAAPEGLDIRWLVGDVEELPLPDNDFDLVVSTFGVECAPQPELVVSELHRVLRPGGTLALAQWRRAGFMGALAKIFHRWQPLSAGLADPLVWGDDQAVRARLAAGFHDIQTREEVLEWHFGSTTELRTFWASHFPPTMAAFAELGADSRAGLHADLADLAAAHRDGDGYRLPLGYLVIRGTAS